MKPQRSIADASAARYHAEQADAGQRPREPNGVRTVGRSPTRPVATLERSPGEDDGPEPVASAAAKRGAAIGVNRPSPKGPARVAMATIEPRPIDWLWAGGRIQRGAVVSIDGIPAAGKSSLATEMVACVSTGRPLFGASSSAPRAAIWIGHEEGLATALRPRLDAALADASRVYVYPDPPSFPGQYGWLASEIRQVDAAIVIIDPIDAYLDFGAAGDSHRNGDVRARLMGLAVVAEETGATIVMIRHWRKGGGVHALYRAAGSIAYSAIARAIISVAPDPTDPSRRIACWSKQSDAPEPSSIAFSLTEGRRIQWIGEDPRSATEVMAASDASASGRGRGGDVAASATDSAENWLMEELEQKGEAPAREILKAGLLAGHTARVLRRARERLGIRVRQQGVAGQRGAGGWIWIAARASQIQTPDEECEAPESPDDSEGDEKAAPQLELTPFDSGAPDSGAPRVGASELEIATDWTTAADAFAEGAAHATQEGTEHE